MKIQILKSTTCLLTLSTLIGCQTSDTANSSETVSIAEPKPAAPIVNNEPVEVAVVKASVNEAVGVNEDAAAALFAEKYALPEVEEAPAKTVAAPVVSVESVEFVKPTGRAEPQRVTPSLPEHPLATLNEADELLQLSNEQYNALVEILEERTTVWKALLAEKGSLSSEVFDRKKGRIFSDYSKRMIAVFDPEQRKLWHARNR